MSEALSYEPNNEQVNRVLSGEVPQGLLVKELLTINELREQTLEIGIHVKKLNVHLGRQSVFLRLKDIKSCTLQSVVKIVNEMTAQSKVYSKCSEEPFMHGMIFLSPHLWEHHDGRFHEVWQSLTDYTILMSPPPDDDVVEIADIEDNAPSNSKSKWFAPRFVN